MANRILGMFLTLVALLAIATASQAATYYWDGGGTTDTGWNTAANWSSNTVPGSSDYAYCTTAWSSNYYTITLAGGTASASRFQLGGLTSTSSNGIYTISNAGSANFQMTSGSLTLSSTSYTLFLMSTSGKTVNFSLSGGDISCGSGTFYTVGNSSTGGGTVNIAVSGGSLSTTTTIALQPFGTSIFTQTGGTVSCASLLLGYEYRSTGTGKYQISDGTLNASMQLYVSQYTSGGTDANYGLFEVVGNAATITAGNVYLGSERGTLSFVMGATGVSPIVMNNTASGVVNLEKNSGHPGKLALDFSALTSTIGDIMLIDNKAAAAISGTFGAINVTGATKTLIEGQDAFQFGDGSYYTLTYTGGTGNNDLVLIAHPIPEPATMVLLASGLVGLLAYAWRKRK